MGVLEPEIILMMPLVDSGTSIRSSWSFRRVSSSLSSGKEWTDEATSSCGSVRMMDSGDG